MAKFRGRVGFVSKVESAPGVWTEEAHEHTYTGDLLRSSKQSTNTGQINDNIVISNRVSIVADAFALGHLSTLKYVIFDEAYWKVTSVEYNRPRLILTVGGVYNGSKAKTS